MVTRMSTQGGKFVVSTNKRLNLSRFSAARMGGRWSCVLLTGALVVAGVGVSGVGAASASTRPPLVSANVRSSVAGGCTAKPFKVMIIGTTSGPDVLSPVAIPDGIKAASHAVNADCQDGRPIDAIFCNDTGTAAGDIACADDAVDDKVIAYAGDASTSADSYNPILEAHGIPNVGSYSNGSTDITDPLSFPMSTSVAQILAWPIIAKDAGVKRLLMIGIQIPTITYFDSLIQSACKRLGITFLPPVNAPLSATDLTPYVAQAMSENPQAIIPITDVVPIVEDLHAINAKVLLLNSTIGYTDADQHQLGTLSTGTLIDSPVWFQTDPSNPGIAQYYAQLKAVGVQPTGQNITAEGVIAWEEVHIFADLMQGAKTFNSAEVIKRVKTHGPWTNLPAVPEFDWSKVQYLGNPVLGSFKLYTRYVAVGCITSSGKIASVAKGFVEINSVTKIKVCH